MMFAAFFGCARPAHVNGQTGAIDVPPAPAKPRAKKPPASVACPGPALGSRIASRVAKSAASSQQACPPGASAGPVHATLLKPAPVPRPAQVPGQPMETIPARARPTGLDDLLAAFTPAGFLATVLNLLERPLSGQALLAQKEEREGRHRLSPALLAGLAQVRESVAHAGTGTQQRPAPPQDQALYSHMLGLEAAFENHLRRPGGLADFMHRITTDDQLHALCEFLGIELPACPGDACMKHAKALLSSLDEQRKMTLSEVDEVLATLMPPGRSLPRVRPELLVRWFARLGAQASDPADRAFMRGMACDLERSEAGAQQIVDTVRLYIRFAQASASGNTDGATD
jgi:hypothetical protein